MTNFTIHTLETAPAEAREGLEAATRKFGFLPNLLGELASAPAALKGYLALNGLLAESSLSPVEQQLVLIAASRSNKCSYCVAAHTAGLKMAGAPQDLLDAAREGQSVADPRLEALRKFTIQVVEKRGEVSEAETQAFLSAGYRPEQILEVLLGVAMKTLSNYANHIARTPLDAGLQPFAWSPR